MISNTRQCWQITEAQKLIVTVILYSAIGTFVYTAPEMLNFEEYYEAVDVWCLGALTYILLAGYHPFDKHSNLSTKKIVEKVRARGYDFEGANWKRISNAAKDLVARCLVYPPEERYTINEFLQHPWITSPDEYAPKDIIHSTQPSMIDNEESEESQVITGQQKSGNASERRGSCFNRHSSGLGVIIIC